MKCKPLKVLSVTACMALMMGGYAMACWTTSGSLCAFDGETVSLTITCQDSANTALTYTQSAVATENGDYAPGDFAVHPVSPGSHYYNNTVVGYCAGNWFYHDCNGLLAGPLNNLTTYNRLDPNDPQNCVH